MIKKIIVLSLLLLGILNATNITLNKTTYINSEPVTVNFSGMTAKNQDWIGIYPKNSSNDWGNVVAWHWTGDTTNGQVTFETLPTGEYEARAFYNNSFTLEAKKAFKVEIDTATAPILVTNKVTYTNSEPVTITFTKMQVKNQDWIGVYPKNSSNAWGNVVAWQWTNDTTDGNITFETLPTGEYEARAFYNNSFYVEAKKTFNVTIDTSTAPTLVTNKTTYGNDENITVNFAEMQVKNQDWIGIYPKNSSNAWGNVLAWNWTGDTTNGQVEFNALPVGEYEVRAFYNNSFYLEAKKAFVVGIVTDTVKPIITLLGNKELNITKGTIYNDAGATADDNIDGNLTNNIVTNNLVNINTVGTYTITYNVEDTNHNQAIELTRTVNVIEVVVVDTVKPVITLLGESEVTVTLGTAYNDAGATATDNIDGDITANIAVNNLVNTNVIGTYTVSYNVEDASHNHATKVTRIIHVIKEHNVINPIINISEENKNALIKTIVYPEITLELTTQNTKELRAINQTLIEQNQTIPLKGYKSGEHFYIYNIPLTKGANEINVTAVSDKGVEASKIFTVHTEFNSTIPLGMRATKYSAVDSLETNITVGTSLDAVEYLLDINRDGVIDETQNDGNFTLTLEEEGRYKPRVTIRTSDGLLFSSDYFALSLDVKGDDDQIDPEGSDPLTLAKEFFQIILEDDRARVEELLAYNPRMLLFLYKNPNTLKEVKKRIPKIKPDSWKMTYHNNGEATVTCIIQINNDDEYEAGFEFRTLSMQVYTGRFWYIKTLY